MSSRFELILVFTIMIACFIPIVRYQQDSDHDGIVNGQDNCVFVSNPDQANTDQDKFGNVCDICPTTPSGEKRCVRNCYAVCTSHCEWYQDDTDHDGIGDECDPAFDE